MLHAGKFLWRLALVAALVVALSGAVPAAVTEGSPSGTAWQPRDSGTVASFDAFRDELRAILAGDDPDAWLCHPVATYCDLLKDTYWSLLNLALPSTSNALNWIYLASALAIGALVYAGHAWRTGAGGGLRDTLRFLVPGSIYLHRSAIVDYKFYFANGLILSLVSFSTMILSSTYVAEAASDLLDALFGAADWTAQPGWTDRLVYSVALVLALDLGYYLFHRLVHAVPVLWEFHKVHHAAEVLTPVTGTRNHPVDSLLEWAFTSVALGLAQGIFGHLHGHDLDALTLFNTSAVMFVFNVTANLRHTHIWVSYGRIASRILSSPAQHQIHHSTAARHLGKNLGRVFSLWDWMFGTIYVPTARETLKIGLDGGESAEYRSVWRCYAIPIVKVARLSLSGGRAAKA
jgi:sterol desaturase/sphingolipid hydroxylase (fatty acid hydroxylase superfamily)